MDTASKSLANGEVCALILRWYLINGYIRIPGEGSILWAHGFDLENMVIGAM